MGFLDALFGRNKPVRSKTEKLFAIGTARVSLEMNLGVSAGDVAGVCYRPVESGVFEQMQQELGDLLRLTAEQSSSRIEQRRDDFGMQWVIVHDPDFDGLVAAIHMVCLTLEDKGFRDQVLAAAFRFNKDGRPIYWLYNYKRGAYYPFIPSGPHEQDESAALRYGSVMEKDLPLEKETTQWYPLWGIPF